MVSKLFRVILMLMLMFNFFFINYGKVLPNFDFLKNLVEP